MADRVQRFDFARLDAARPRTPQGFLRVPARMTRVGVLAYRKSDGTIQRELRPPEEVFKADSLATLRGAPVTDRHPKEMVTPRNARKLSIGFVGDNVREDGRYVSGEPTIIDEGRIKAVERGDLQECSAGYSCRIDAKPGVFEGEPYDVVQRDIVYNHVALGPANWGRAGREVGLRLDSDDDLHLGPEDAIQVRTDGDWKNQDPADSTKGSGKKGRKETLHMDTITIRIDGVDYEIPKSAAPHVQKALDDRDAKIKTLESERDKAQGRCDGLEKDLEDTKGQLAEATDPQKIQERVDARNTLESDARKVLGDDADLAGKSDREIKAAVIAKAAGEIKLDDKSDDYVDGRFEHIVSTSEETKRADSGDKQKVRDALRGKREPKPRTDADPFASFKRPFLIDKDRQAS